MSEQLTRNTRILDSLSLRRRREYDAWFRGARRAPRPLILKQQIDRDIARELATRVLFEARTYFDDKLWATSSDFAQLHSIALGPELRTRATRHLRRRPHMRIRQSDSGTVQPPGGPDRVTRPALFGLDAHYSGGLTATAAEESAVLAEFSAIFAGPVRGHVALNDDARCFTWSGYGALGAAEPTVRGGRLCRLCDVADGVSRIRRSLGTREGVRRTQSI